VFKIHIQTAYALGRFFGLFRLFCTVIGSQCCVDSTLAIHDAVVYTMSRMKELEEVNRRLEKMFLEEKLKVEIV